jgi:hypothetical protein
VVRCDVEGEQMVIGCQVKMVDVERLLCFEFTLVDFLKII